MPIFYQLIIPSEVIIRASVSQQLASTTVGVTTTPPPSRTVSVANAALQADAASSLSVTIPPVTIAASGTRPLSTTGVGVTRGTPGTRTVSVTNASLQTSASSAVSVTVPQVAISASVSQGLSTTAVGVSRTVSGSRTVSVSGASLQTSASASVTVTIPTVTVLDSASQGLSATAVGVTTTPPPSRTANVSNAGLQTSASSSASVTVPSVAVSASASVGLSTTGVGVNRTAPDSRTVGVSNASLETISASSISAEVPQVTISASTSQGLTTTVVSVSRTPPPSRSVSVSNASLQTSASAGVERAFSIFDDFTRDARWDSVGTVFTDLDGATKATAHIRADVGLGDTGILMEHGATGDGLAVAVVTDEDGNGNELRGTERILAMFGEGSTTTGNDTAVLDHRLGYRISGVDTTLDNYSTTLKGDWRDDIEEGYEIGWESETGTDTVDVVTYSSANNETTIEHSYRAGASSDTVYFVQDRVEVTWSADTGVGQCVLYEEGVPVDTDPIQNSRLCGGDNGTIGNKVGGVRELGQNWSSADYEYESTVFFADIYLNETTQQVVSEYKTEDLSVTPAIYRNTGLKYGQDDQGNQTVDLGRASSARVYVDINGDPGVEDGIVAHWGADVDGAILYMHDGNLYLQVGDGSVAGGSAECIVADIGDGAHIIEWTANIDANELQLYVDGVKEDTDTGWSYSGDLAGSNPDGIGQQKSNIPANRGDFSKSKGRLNRDVKKAETYEGASWLTVEIDVSASTSQGLTTTGAGVFRTPPPSRTVSVSNGSLQTSAASSASVTVPSVKVSASTSQSLSTTGVGVSRAKPPSRTAKVANGTLKTNTSSSSTATVPSATVAASASQGLSTTTLGVTRTSSPARTVSVSNGQINRSTQASIAVETNAPPNAALSATPTTGLGASFDASGSSDPDSDTLEFRFDPGDGSGFSAWQSTAIFTYNYSSSGTYNVTVEVREANTTEQFTDTATDSVSVSGGGFPF